jgi:hypothetical protein
MSMIAAATSAAPCGKRKGWPDMVVELRPSEVVTGFPEGAAAVSWVCSGMAAPAVQAVKPNAAIARNLPICRPLNCAIASFTPDRI